MKKDILKLGMKIVKNTAIKLAERDANINMSVLRLSGRTSMCRQKAEKTVIL